MTTGPCVHPVDRLLMNPRALEHVLEDVANMVYEHPADDGVPQAVRAVHMDQNQDVGDFFIPNEEMEGEYGGEYGGEYEGEYEGEYGVYFGGAGGLMAPDSDEEEDEDRHAAAWQFALEDAQRWFDEEEEEDDDVTDNSSDWNDDLESEDSGYESMDEDEEVGDEDEDFRAPSPQVQQPPQDQEDPPVVVRPPFIPGPLAAAGPSGSDEAVPSTSGQGSSMKRSREEKSDAAQDRTKRQRLDYEGVDDEQPSTSGLSSSTFTHYWAAPYDDSDSD